MNKKKLIIEVLASVAIFLTIRHFMPEPSVLGNQNTPPKEYGVVIIPTEGIPSAFLKQLDEKLEDQHKINFLVTTQIGKNDEMIIKKTGQLSANHLAVAGARFASRIGVKAFHIVLTNEDINTLDQQFRFVFSANFEGISVVSLARIHPSNIGESVDIFNLSSSIDILTERAMKLINKSIGREYYGYPVSSDIASVMYGPIMGLKDLDDMGSWYTK